MSGFLQGRLKQAVRHLDPRWFMWGKVVLALFIVSFLLVKPFNVGMANGLSQLVTYKHDRWLGEYRVNSTPSDEQIEGVDQLVTWMLDFDPEHPHYLSLASSHNVWLSIFKPDEKQRYLKAAYELEKRSVQRRPTWFMSYVNLAKISHFLGEDPSLWLSLSQRYGPYTTEVKTVHVEVVFPLWRQAEPDLRVVAMRSVYDLLASKPDVLNRSVAALQSDAQSRVCRLIALKKAQLPVCDG